MELGVWLAKLQAARSAPPSAQPLVDAAQRAAGKARALAGGRGTIMVSPAADGARIQTGDRRTSRAVLRTLPEEMTAARQALRDEVKEQLS